MFQNSTRNFCFKLYALLSVKFPEPVARGCSLKKLFWKIWLKSLESTSAKVSFLIKLQAEAFYRKFCEIFQTISLAEQLLMTVSAFL